MWKIINGIIVGIIVVVLIALYGLKLIGMGMSVKSIAVFVAMFVVIVAIGGGLVMVFTRGIRKKLNDELKSGKNNDNENSDDVGNN